MKDESMFARLYGYEEPVFREEHPVVEFETAADRKEYEKAVDEICQKAPYDTESWPSYPQELWTLSTCRGKGRDSRFVVVAAKGLTQY